MKSFHFGSVELHSLLKGLGVALAGALIVWIPTVLSGIDFGVWTPLAVSLASVFVNFLRLWSNDNRPVMNEGSTITNI